MMDPALEELLDGPGHDVIEGVIRLADPRQAPERFRIVARFGSVATGRMRRKDIRQIWSDPSVVSLKAPRLLEFGESWSTPPNRTALWRGAANGPERGRGVIVGIVDWGFDFVCPSFRHADGTTRILGIWDQRDTPRVANSRPYGYGRFLTERAINDALNSSDPYRLLDYHPVDADTGDGSHGTHVLDIAAGNARHSGPAGLAQDAKLICVHLAAGSLSGLANLGDSVRILEALDYIRRIAGPRPFIANLSVGRHAGPHTGVTLVEQAIDTLVSNRAGCAVVMSTGNYYQADAHAEGRLTPGRLENLVWLVQSEDPTTNELEIWYPQIDRFQVLLNGPEGVANLEAGLGQNATITANGREVGRLYHRSYDPNSPDHHVNVFLYPGAPTGEWRLTLIPIEVRDGRWHAWVERDSACRRCQSRLVSNNLSRRHTTGSICNGFLSIAVGALDTTQTNPTIAPFSSSGPTRDGRQKPDVVAPGVAILAARSAPIVGSASRLTRKSGASQAAPFVTGAIACLFEAAKRPLSIHETRALLLGTAQPLADSDSSRVGAGAINVEAALEAARLLRNREHRRGPASTHGGEHAALYAHS